MLCNGGLLASAFAPPATIADELTSAQCPRHLRMPELPLSYTEDSFYPLSEARERVSFSCGEDGMMSMRASDPCAWSEEEC